MKKDNGILTDVTDDDINLLETKPDEFWKGVTSIGNKAFEYCTVLTKVVIPEGVVSIGEYAFGRYFNLIEVTFPNTLVSIGKQAFVYCESLRSVSLPKSVKTIGEWAFGGCKIKSINIPSGVTNIGESAFTGCTKLSSINVDESNSVYSSVSGVLYNKDKTELVSYPCGRFGDFLIPDGVTSIKANAFMCCMKLTNITIPDNVITIEERAFYGCKSLVNVTIPSSVTSIGNKAFYECENLRHVKFSDGSKLTSIGQCAFKDCYMLLDITIPSKVSSIGENAFYLCYFLKNIDVDKSNETYSSVDGVLYNKDKTQLICCPCRREGEFNVPDSVTNINGAFNHCNKLTRVTIPDGVTEISEETFLDCESLISVTIPKSVTSIGRWAFFDCASLAVINYDGTVAEWDKISKGKGWDKNTGLYIFHFKDAEV